MFNKHISSKLFVAGAVLAVFGLSSCIDNDYDLDNIDMTLGSNVDLNLPACSTGEIQLKNLIDLEEDGVVQLVDNPNGGGKMYVVCEDGKANIDPISIGQIKVSKPKLDNFNSHVTLIPTETAGSARSEARNAAPKHVTIPVAGYNLNLDNLNYEYDLENKASTDIKDAVAASVSSDICELQMVKCTPNSMTLKLAVHGVPNHFGNLHLDNFKLTLPRELNITSCTIDGNSIASLADIDGEGNATQTLRLTPIIDVLGHSMNEPLILTIGFDGASIHTSTKDNPATEMDNVVLDGTTHDVSFGGSLSVTGVFRVEASEMDIDKLTQVLNTEINSLTTEEKIQVITELSNGKFNLSRFASIIPTSLNFTGENSFAGDIVITKVTGKFKHEIGHIDPIMLDDLPDFLNDEEVVLDLDNPMLFISASTTLPADVATSIKLIGKKADKMTERHVNDVTIEGMASKVKVFWMANREEKVFVPQQYTKDDVNLIYTPLFTYNGTQDVTADLTGLIKDVPNQIDVEVGEVTLTATDLDITKSYDVNVDYQIFAPLAFGPEFMLVYQDTEEGFDIDDSMDDVEFSEDAVIELDAEISSTLPTSCTFTVTPLDKYGNILKDEHGNEMLTPISITIPAKASSYKPETIVLKAINRHNLNEILHSGETQLDGIRYRAVLDNVVPGEVLTDEGSIVVKNIKLRVKAGVSYDAN